MRNRRERRAALPARARCSRRFVRTYLRFVQERKDSKSLGFRRREHLMDWPRGRALFACSTHAWVAGHLPGLCAATTNSASDGRSRDSNNRKAAVVAVLNDNIYGLELDERCTQIAAFNVALTAWKIAGVSNSPSVSPCLLWKCSASATESEWTALPGSDERLPAGHQCDSMGSSKMLPYLVA